MKALIYKNHDEINLNYIVNLVGKIERQRISKVSLVIVEVELFLKLREEGMKNGFFFRQYWWQKNRFSSGIKVNNFNIISSYEIQKEIHLTFDN